MQPPYEVTPRIVALVSEISELLGVVRTIQLDRPEARLRKENRIKTIHHSLSIEGNTLDLNQVTAVMEGKHVIGRRDEIQEVENAIRTYLQLDGYSASDEASFLSAHGTMMLGLDKRAGKYRNSSVAIAKGDAIAHIAPPHTQVPHLMQDIFKYINQDDELPLIKSCVCHYEIEFIHPFSDGNGRMGRLWQTVILLKSNPVFAHLPIEQLIHAAQAQYYEVLAACDRAGKSTAFIEFMLALIQQSLSDLLASRHSPLDQAGRLAYFLEQQSGAFTRKDYLSVFRHISSATASRDLSYGVAEGLLTMEGEKRMARYKKR